MYHTGKIIRKSMASPTVMVLDLHVPNFSFLPGQWVDFMVPPHQWVGGFSIASSPRDVPLVRLAIKRSDHAPAKWVHDHSKVHETVQVSVGGTSVLEKDDDAINRRPSVFCAGGIGISPILSQYREFLHQRAAALLGTGNDDMKPRKTLFLYSVSTPDELVFAEELADLSRPGSELGHDRMVFTVTQSTSSWNQSVSYNQGIATATHIERRGGRQLIETLEEAPANALYYICGPPSMIDEAVQHLERKGIPSDNIKFEKWW
ncbi:oxidoreductase NAD-binding domain containing protein [Nitzschia inconspicua]|uniref:Oxidoreductase NAD-binding domain-containing protein 1 n=1 Tax=Nitzschia inconspicua TaxID=303405 RepID=A0A9K3PW05_9STRA|nr:oxidoreductase NAD-binding domain containing protein [Nitzschia inconspicua]